MCLYKLHTLWYYSWVSMTKSTNSLKWFRHLTDCNFLYCYQIFILWKNRDSYYLKKGVSSYSEENDAVNFKYSIIFLNMTGKKYFLYYILKKTKLFSLILCQLCIRHTHVWESRLFITLVGIFLNIF